PRSRPGSPASGCGNTRRASRYVPRPLKQFSRRNIMSKNDRLKEREELLAKLEDRRQGRDIAFLIAGAGVGAGIALLLAPRSGEELRHAIGRSYHQTAKRLGRQTEDLRDRAEELLARAHDLRERGVRLLHLGRREEVPRRVA